MAAKYPVNWFEIPVNDLSKAQAFYEYILKAELMPNEMGPVKMAWFPMIQNGEGAAGTLVKAEGHVPSHSGTLIYFSVEDIEETLKRINQKGGKTLEAKQSIGEYGYFAVFEDTEGNRIGLHSQQ
jgi:predicted enzyme related to lactoylglutathione lyase